MCWRRAPLQPLPFVPFECIVLSADLPDFPIFDLSDLLGFLDAACGTCPLTRRSAIGLLFMCAGAAVLHKTRLMSIVATGSTEAEFIAAVFAAKQAKHLCSVLTQLGHAPVGPTKICEDNEAAIAMINQNKPAEHSRHIDIQFFAVQEWRKARQIITEAVPATVNPADAGTKALSWVLHS
jgi:hypothetical protein